MARAGVSFGTVECGGLNLRRLPAGVSGGPNRRRTEREAAWHENDGNTLDSIAPMSNHKNNGSYTQRVT